MKSYSALVAVAFAAAANAAKFTNPSINPQPDKPFELTWADAEGPVTINLKGGPSGNLVTIDTLATGVTGDSTTITLKASDLPSDTYAFEIVDGSDVNYSVQFAFAGTGTASTTASATEKTTSSSPSSSATPSKSSSTSGSASRTASSTASGTTSSRPSRTSSADQETETVPDSGSARNMSPLAFIFVAGAAMLYFN